MGPVDSVQELQWRIRSLVPQGMTERGKLRSLCAGFRGAGHAEAGQPGRSPWMSRIETGDGVVREIRASTLADKAPRASQHADVRGRQAIQQVTRGTIEQQDFTAQEPNRVVGVYLLCAPCLHALGSSASLGYDPPGLVPDGRVVGSARGVGLPSQPAR